jgi:hypothetical protein
MSEPMIFKITNELAWDGTTLVDITREVFTKETRFYTTTIEKGGVIKGDFFGLLSGSAPKLVSIAVDSFDPLVRALVTPPFDDDHHRHSIDLTPAYQTVFMAGGDVLRVVSAGSLTPGSRIVTLIVNELSEAEAVRYAADTLRPTGRTIRARITRDDAQPFALNANGPLLTSPFTYNMSIGYLTSTVGGQGYVSVQDLVDPGSEGVYVWVRFTGIGLGDGEVHVVDPRTDESNPVEVGLKSTLWSKPIWMSREDRLSFRTTPPPLGKQAAVEIEVSHVRPRLIVEA